MSRRIVRWNRTYDVPLRKRMQHPLRQLEYMSPKFVSSEDQCYCVPVSLSDTHVISIFLIFFLIYKTNIKYKLTDMSIRLLVSFPVITSILT